MMDDSDVFRCNCCVYQTREFISFSSHYIRYHKLDPNFSVACSVGACAYATQNWGAFRVHMHRKHPDVARQGRARPIPNHAGPRPVGGYDDDLDHEDLDDESGDDEIGRNGNCNNNMFHDFHDINEQQHVHDVQAQVDVMMKHKLMHCSPLALHSKGNLTWVTLQ